MNQYGEDRYYTYVHFDPITSEIMYVGKGTRHRAWTFTKNTSGGRALDHFEYLCSLESLGYTPDDWVKIVDKGLSSTEALEKEMELISKHRPLFNKNYKSKTILTDEDVLAAREMRQQGMIFREIANSFGVSTMTMLRAITGETKRHAK